MGEHDTWLDILLGNNPAYQNLQHSLQNSLGRTFGLDMFETHFSLTHVVFGILVFLFIAFGVSRFRAGVGADGKKGIVPPRSFNIRNLFELATEAIYGQMENVMGEKNARKYLPLIGSLAIFILFSNLLALIPGMGVPTSNLKTNLALSILVFVIYNGAGIKEHGLGYFSHFMGPKLGGFPWLFPLILPIELISHIVRPLSLAIRLAGNMSADHKVLFSFTMLVPILVPVPFFFLGLLVSVVQATVFSLLTMVYISMAVAHDH